MTIQTHDDGVFAATRPRRPIPAFDCDLCEDAGVVRNAMVRVVPCPDCGARSSWRDLDGDAA